MTNYEIHQREQIEAINEKFILDMQQIDADHKKAIARINRDTFAILTLIIVVTEASFFVPLIIHLCRQ